MTRVYVIRHAEAEGNVFRRAHGVFNGQLTPLGFRQLSFLAERFQDISLDSIYSSTLQRAYLTACAIAEGKGISVEKVSGLREINLGIWEDLTWGELQHSYLEQYINFNRYPDAYHVEGSELFCDTKKRLLGTVMELAGRHEGGTIAVTSHGGAIGALLKAVEEASGEKGPKGFSDNTAVSLLEIDGDRVHCIFANDSSHLPKEYTHFDRQNWWQSLESTDSGDMRYETPELSGDMESLVSGWLRDLHQEKLLCDSVDCLYLAVRQKEKPGTYFVSYSGEKPTGITVVDLEKGEILCCYLDPAYRKRYLSAQLVGQAISVLRKYGFSKAVAVVPEGNTECCRYYGQFGFESMNDKTRMVKDIAI